MKIVIPGVPRTKKNSQNVVFVGDRCPVCHKGKRAVPMPSTAYKVYEKEAISRIKSQNVSPVTERCNVKCAYYLPLNKDGSMPKRLPDLANLLEATNDILVAAKVIPDDNVAYIASHDGSAVIFSNEDSRVEIEIKPL